jgi:ATP-dependent protease HslVU (ClpYQ) peptidase subunit
MTTIAFKDGTLAADTMLTRGNERNYGVNKLFRTQHFLIGFSGAMANWKAMVAFIKEHETLLDPGETAEDLHKFWEDAPAFTEYGAMMIDRAHRIFHIVDAPPVYIPSRLDAIGTGGGYAMGAMLFGASAAEAIRVARTVDVHTGGPVSTIRFID